ncbi:MAG: LuxR C-terminal-related transcriptional regulator [Dermatophilaceae bacterium]
MNAVGDSEYDRLLDFVTALLSAPEPSVAWRLVGEYFLGTHFDAEVFTAGEYSETGGTSNVPHATPDWVWRRVPPPAELHEFFSDNPLVNHLATAADHLAPRRSSDAVTMSAWMNSAAHSQLRATLGVSHQLAIPLQPSGGAIRAVVLMRSGHDFSERDLMVATKLQRLLMALDTHLGRSNASCFRSAAGEGMPSDGLHLTQREMAVLRLLADGLTAEAMARRLLVSKRTVDKHLEHVYAKLHESDRLRAVLRAQRLGILPITEA